MVYMLKSYGTYLYLKGRIEWDISKPDGQPRRGLDTSGVKREFGSKPAYPLEEGLKKTIEWYAINCGVV